MTRPSDIKPREGEQRGTTYDDYVIGDTLPPLRFTVTPEIMREYAGVVDGAAGGYEVEGRKAALPSVLQVYFMAVLYSKYPPQQGGVMGSNQFRFFEPIWADASIDIIGTGNHWVLDAVMGWVVVVIAFVVVTIWERRSPVTAHEDS